MPKLSPAVLALALMAAPAFAQGTAITPGQSAAAASKATPQAAPPAPAATATPKADRTAKSKACSAQADQQGLHGKARKRFRSQCKAGKT